MSFVPRLFFLAALLFALSGCNQTSPPPVTVPTVSEPVISNKTSAASANAVAPAPSVLVEQKPAPETPPSSAADSADREAQEIDDLKQQLIESRIRAEESRARLKEAEDRWLVLTDEERERLIRIKRILVENTGITLTPADFLFVYKTDNQIFVDRELQAAAAISCGPFIDFLSERLDWPRDRGLEALGIFARTCTADFSQKEGTQESCLKQVEVTHRELERYGVTTDGMPETLVRLGVLAEVLHQRNRELTDEETVFLREMAPAALRKFLRLGLDPKNVHAREQAIKAANERETIEDREKLIAAREAAIKEMPRVMKRLESLYDKRERLMRANRETAAGNRARAETQQGIIDSEALLSRLVFDVLRASDNPDVTLREGSTSLGPAPQKSIHSLTDHQKKAILDAFPDNSDVRRLVKRLQEFDRSSDDPYSQ